MLVGGDIIYLAVMRQKKEMVIAVDWSYTKGLITYDGKKLRTEDRKALIKRIQATKSKDGEESNKTIQSMAYIHSPSVILEESCPIIADI